MVGFQGAGQQNQFSLRPLHGDLGVEVIGVDLKGGISPELHAELQKIMHTRDLLLFRDQVSGFSCACLVVVSPTHAKDSMMCI